MHLILIRPDATTRSQEKTVRQPPDRRSNLSLGTHHSSLLLLLYLLLSASTAQAVTENYSFSGLNLAIPDGNPTGLINTQNLPSNITSLTSVIVSVSISGQPDGFNGDLYAYLTHSTGFSILLNRSGRTATDADGYDDNGFNVTLSDSAANGDIHLYQAVTTPAAGSPLLGTWQPDGRNTDPALVLNTSPRTAILSSFNALNAAGMWSFFVADVSGGNAHRLDSWSLQLVGVPEPGTAWLLVAGTFALVSRRYRCNSRA